MRTYISMCVLYLLCMFIGENKNYIEKKKLPRNALIRAFRFSPCVPICVLCFVVDDISLHHFFSSPPPPIFRSLLYVLSLTGFSHACVFISKRKIAYIRFELFHKIFAIFSSSCRRGYSHFFLDRKSLFTIRF